MDCIASAFFIVKNMPVQGLWSPFGFNLPDFGISEALGIGPRNAATSPSYGKLGSVQGTNTSTNNFVSTNPNLNKYASYAVSGKSNTGSNYQAPTNAVTNPEPSEPSGPSAEELERQRIIGEISSAWDSYLGSLSDISSTYLPQQNTAQQNIINDQYTSGVSQINTQRSKSLRDIGANIKNAFQAGNVYLGARGAGDSSAANQYQFALSQEASKQTGTVNEFVNGQLNQMTTQRDTQLNQLSTWFTGEQMKIKHAIASGQLSKSQDIANLSKQLLDQAVAYRQQIYQNSETRKNTLLEWAANNSTNVNQLVSNISALPQAIGSPVFSGGSVSTTAPGYGIDDDERNKYLSGYNWFT